MSVIDTAFSLALILRNGRGDYHKTGFFAIDGLHFVSLHVIYHSVQCFWQAEAQCADAASVRAGRNVIYCEPQSIATLAEPRSGPTMIGPWTGDDASRAVKKDVPQLGGHPGGQRSAPGTSQPSFVE
jgi:hypothetical protein